MPPEEEAGEGKRVTDHDDDEKDSCGLLCPKCGKGNCIKDLGHFGRSHHVCGKCRHSWR